MFLAGKGLPFWAIAMSVVVTDIGATNLTFGAGAAYTVGMAQINFDWIGSMPACLIAGLLFIPFFWRSGVYTIPEFLGRRYNVYVQRLSALFWLVFLGINLAIMMHASAIILQEFLGVKYELSLWGTGLAVAFYTVAGGLAAVVMTDSLQMIVIFIGTAALLTLGLFEVGGWEGMTAGLAAQGEATQKHMELMLPHDSPTALSWTAVIFGLGLVQSTAYFTTNQAIIQRNLGARSEWDAKAGMVLAGFLKFLMPVLIIFPGLIAAALYPNLKDANTAIPEMIKNLFPPGLTGLMVAAFLAAFMSGVSSYLGSTSTMFLADVYLPIYRFTTGADLSSRHALLVGRITTAAAIVIACACAPLLQGRDQTIYNFIQLLMSIFFGPTLAIMLLGIVWKRANGWGGLSGLAAGVAFTSYMTFRGQPLFSSKEPFLYVSLFAFLFAMLVTIVASLCTKPEPPEKIRGLTMGQLVGKAPPVSSGAKA